MKSIVVYATDEKYVKLTAVSICSLLIHNPHTDIAIFTDGISLSSKKLLLDLAATHNSNIKLFDVSGEIKKLQSFGAPGYSSFSIYSRYFAPEKLQDDYDRFVYIDSDTIISGDITELINMQLHDNPFAIGFDCLHNAYKRLIDLPPERPYFNSGVLLVDIEKWNKAHCTTRFFDCLKTRRGCRFILPDQDIIAHSLADEAAILPPQYNFLTHFQMLKTRNNVLRATGIPASAWYTEEQYVTAQKRPIIHHFLGHTLGRPWYRESLNPLRQSYCKFAAEAGLPEITEQSRPVDFCYKVQHLAWKALPPFLFSYACRAMYAYFFRTRYKV